MNKDLIVRHILPLTLTATMLGGAASCNKDSGSSITEYETAVSVAVTKFTLTADTKVMDNLDQVFFSIDLTHGVIFNADSLPVGTKVTKLIPVITYPSDVSAAELRIDDGTEVTTVDYKSNPTDSIDFTRPVQLTLTGGDGVTKSVYTIKINVHTNDPDSVIWDRIAGTSLPSRLENPIAQKTVKWHDSVLTMIEESDGTYTAATTEDLTTANWTRTEVSTDAKMRVSTLAVTPSALYILSENVELFSSSDGSEWTSTGETWLNTIGAYGDVLLGIGGNAVSGLRHVNYPADSLPETALENDFPIDGYSAFAAVTSDWSDKPVGVMTGGRLADGTLTAATWGFDGDTWTRLDISSPPAIEGATVVPYYIYRQTSTTWIQTEFDVWLLFGGRLSDGSLNSSVYVSYTNGVNWSKAPDLMQLPDFMQPGYDADGIVMNSPRDANLADAWITRANPSLHGPMRIAYDIDGYQINWECPYIYLFGGYDTIGYINDVIWRGVLARLTYTPLL
ncbi:MAG: DUF5018 domain-containing protein [Muribaculaceae bacterium]|nr:DUF5018 domain-containing protein [Muribaculaceae bacterium]